MSSLLGGFAGLGGGSIGRASVDLVLNAQAYEAQLAGVEGQTAAATSKMGTGFAGFQQKVRESFNGAQVAAVGFGAVAAAGIAKAVSATQSWTAEVIQLQRVTGQSAEDASRLAAAGDALGVSSDKLNVGLGLLSKNIVNGSANLTKYGVALKDAQGNTLPFNEILGNLADKFNTLQSGPEQAAFAMNVFGRSGKSLIPLLKQGSDGLAEMESQADKLGLTLSQQDLDASRQLAIAQRELGEAFKGAAVQIGVQFVPVLTRLAEDVTTVVELLNKVPGPVKASVLAFVALNGALVALRGIWSITSGIIAQNAAALGAHTAASEADAAATEADTVATEEAAAANRSYFASIQQKNAALAENTAATEANAAAQQGNAAATGLAGAAAKLLNSELVANLAPMIALTKATQDAISEWDNFKAGNYPGALHDVTTELSFYTGGLVQTIPDVGAFQASLQALNDELKAGTITQQDATQQAQELANKYGVTLPQSETAFINAQTGANTATQQGTSDSNALAGAQGRLANATQQATRAALAHAQAIRTEREQQLQEAGGFTGLIASMDQVKQDEAALNKLRQQGKQGTDAYKAAVIQATEDQLSYRTSLRQVADQLQQNGDSIGKVKGILREMATQAGVSLSDFRAAFRSTFQSAGQDIDNLNNKLNAIPNNIAVRVNVDAVTNGNAEIAAAVARYLARGQG